MTKEEKCIILDFLPSGYADRRHAEPVAQAIGTNFFTLLELVPKEGVVLKTEEEVYVGEGKRDEIKFIKGQLEYNNLTNMSQNLLPEVVERIVKTNEKFFVDFFNRGTVITPRMHQFQLLPGVGKKHLIDMLDERRKKAFESFQDIHTRVKLFPDPIKTVVRRVLDELKGTEKYHLFTPVKQKRVF